MSLSELWRQWTRPRPKLLEVVQHELVQAFPIGAARVARFAMAFPDGPVDVEVGEMLLRIDRDYPSGFLEVDFASHADTTWFLWEEVSEYLHLPPSRVQASSDSRKVVSELREFLRVHLAELQQLFARDGYADRKRGLMEARVRRNLRIAPPVQSRRSATDRTV